MSAPSSRMLTLLSLLQARRDWPSKVLADRLGVTTRTVRRDVERLRELGYRIGAVKGPDGGYRLEAGSELPPLLFDDDQAVAIAVALQSASASGVDIEEAAQRALVTVRQVMPSRLRQRIDRVRFTGSDSAELVDPAVLEAVSDAVRGRMTLRFGYGDPQAPPRHAEPHGLVARNARWYLVAWDIDCDDWRIYRLDRMSPRYPAGSRFVPRPVPTGDAGGFVGARAKGSDDANQWPCVGQFEISLPAREVVPWIRDGQVEPTSGHTALVTAGSWSWTGLVTYVLRFNAPFRIIGPVELDDAAQEIAERLTAARNTTN
ncbi:helix-turn-helix transcriptional regulator [Phytoactinopolyspora limicola]|uniref:helix-turn-helix transcriptional regulator n=1 Tax=Phytoactinopolyspora limicola TaxID=2715536 RepID=UPI00140CDA9A|nr:WYL domain-containing protein [Phytoactinopolyspora limicola]